MTHLVVTGLNYHSTPIAIRERFIIPESCLQYALEALSKLPHVTEAALLSTCNRTEVYAVVSNVEEGIKELDAFFVATQSIAAHEVLRPNFKLLREDVALHLFRVSAGLDSMVLGEGQIMSQVKSAYKLALEAGTIGSNLDRLFKLALNCGKRVRSETRMGQRAVSVSSAAIELGRHIFGSLRDRTIVVIGSGKMAQICMKLLLNEPGQGSIYLLNRGKERTEHFIQSKLPNKHRLKVGLDFSERHKVAALADLVIVSTSAPNYLLTRQQLLGEQLTSGLCIIDISVPRNVDPTLAELPLIQLYHADDLGAIVARNLADRETLVAEAEGIVFETLEEFKNWQRSLLVIPTITELRDKIEAIRQEQVSRTSNSVFAGNLSIAKQQMENISKAIVNQILHHPTIQLKSTKDYGMLRQQTEAIETLFNLGTCTDNIYPRKSAHRNDLSYKDNSSSHCPFK